MNKKKLRMPGYLALMAIMAFSIHGTSYASGLSVSDDESSDTDIEEDYPTINLNNDISNSPSYDNYDKDVTISINVYIEEGWTDAKYLSGVEAQFYRTDRISEADYTYYTPPQDIWDAVNDGTWKYSEYFYIPEGSWAFDLYKGEGYLRDTSEVFCYQSDIDNAKKGESYTINCLLGETEWVENNKDMALPSLYTTMGKSIEENSKIKEKEDALDSLRDGYGCLIAENAPDKEYFINTLLTNSDRVRVFSIRYPDYEYSLSGKYYKVYYKWHSSLNSGLGSDMDGRYLRSEFDNVIPEGKEGEEVNLDSVFLAFCNDNSIILSGDKGDAESVSESNKEYTDSMDNVANSDNEKEYDKIEAESEKTWKDYLYIFMIVAGFIIITIIAIARRLSREDK